MSWKVRVVLGNYNEKVIITDSVLDIHLRKKQSPRGELRYLHRLVYCGVDTMANYCYSTPQEQQFFQLQTINNNENMDIITDVYQSSVFYVDQKMFLALACT